MFPSAAVDSIISQIITTFYSLFLVFSAFTDFGLRYLARWPRRGPSAHLTGSDRSIRHLSPFPRFASMLWWDKRKEVEYAHLCDSSSPHQCQMATYLWKEVSTNINLHVSESTKWWKNRNVFNFSNTTDIQRVGRGYLQIQELHKEARQSATTKAGIRLLSAETQTDDGCAHRKWHHSFWKELFQNTWFSGPFRHTPAFGPALWKLTLWGHRCPGSGFQNTPKSVSVAKAGCGNILWFCVTPDTTAQAQDVVEKLTMTPHGGENHLVCYSVLFTGYFHSTITFQKEKMRRTHLLTTCRIYFSTFRMNCSTF